jgi:amino acid transporter
MVERLFSVLLLSAAIIALFTPFNYLSDMTSISSLFGFLLVALALLWRRYHGAEGAAKGASPRLPAGHLIWLVASGIGARMAVLSPQASMLHGCGRHMADPAKSLSCLLHGYVHMTELG